MLLLLLLFRWQFVSLAKAILGRRDDSTGIGLLIKPNNANLYGTGVPLTLSRTKLFSPLTIVHHGNGFPGTGQLVVVFLCGISVQRDTTAHEKKDHNIEELSMAAV
jgi:hypothetical protein